MDKLPLKYCPHCNTEYKVVYVEAIPANGDGKITCLSCGGPLTGRDGRFILKYFRADEPRKQAGKRYAGIRSR